MFGSAPSMDEIRNHFILFLPLDGVNWTRKEKKEN